MLYILAAIPLIIVMGTRFVALMAGDPAAFADFGIDFVIALLVTLGISVPVYMALWFAPALVKLLKPDGSIVIEVGNGWNPGAPTMSTLALESLLEFKKRGELERFTQKLIDGMLKRGYSLEFAQSIAKFSEAFASYSFPMSHSASFALLTYASCWIKCHHPAEFLAAMLNSQPLGFYSASQLVQDAKRHGVEVRRSRLPRAWRRVRGARRSPRRNPCGTPRGSSGDIRRLP